MGSKIEKAGENFFRPVNKAVKRSGLAGILPYASMALPFLGLPGGAFTRYLLPQLMTSASSVAEGGKLNPLRNLTTLGASYLAGPTANRPGGADPFKLRDEPKIFMDKANQLPPGAFGGKTDPTMFQKFKAGIGDLGEQAKNYVQSGNITGIPDADTLAQFTQPAKTVGTLVGADRSLNAYEAAKQAEKDYKNSGSDDGYNSAEYTSYLKKYLANAGYSQEEIDDYMANRPSYNIGGRVGYNVGGDVQGLTGDQLRLLYKESLGKGYDSTFEDFISDFGNVPEDFMSMGDPTSQSIIDMLTQESIEEQIPPKEFKSFVGGPKSLLDPKEMQVASNSDDSFYQKMLESGIINDNVTLGDVASNSDDFDIKSFIEGLRQFPSSDSDEAYTEEFIRTMRNGAGIASLKMGGMPSMEMDYRGGGFIPVGSKEKADDVPARLSKNEFVMTADAVRAAGGGSVNKGAQKMYQLMNQLESKV